MEVAVLKQGVLRQRLPREKLTSGLPTSSHSRRAPCLNPDRQSDSLTLLEIAPRKFQPHSRRHPAYNLIRIPKILAATG
jgi:hypothetical protein